MSLEDEVDAAGVALLRASRKAAAIWRCQVAAQFEAVTRPTRLRALMLDKGKWLRTSRSELAGLLAGGVSGATH